MKYLFSVIVIALCCTAHISAQDIDESPKGVQFRIGDVDISVRQRPFMKGDWELSTTGSIGNTSTKSTITSIGEPTTTLEESTFYYYLSLLAGYYVLDGFSIEPEFTIIGGGESGQYGILNLSYTYLPKKMGTAFYLRGGYGFGNVVVLPANPSNPFGVGNGAKIFNSGAGCKILVGQNVALRIELNYIRQMYSHQSMFTNSDETSSTFRLLFGFSILP